MPTTFSSPLDATERLGRQGYLADDAIGTVTYLAGALDRPLLVEGPAGVGKTELAKSTARALARPLIRLQCYEGLDETRAIYEWDYRKQLLRIQAEPDRVWSEIEDDIFSERFLLERPLLQAIRAQQPVALLIDEVDRLDLEAEALLLEVLSDWQITIPEIGTVTASTKPVVVLTSNATRELSEALKRRCLYLPLTYPNIERETEILTTKIGDLSPHLAAKVAEALRALRDLDLKKAPSIGEALDWAATLVMMGATELEPDVIETTLGVVVKHAEDIEAARVALLGP